MNTFEQNINKETKTIEEFINSNKNINLINIQNEGYTRYDFSFNIKDKYGICEVKTRTITSYKYKGEGVMLELDKVTALALKIGELKNNSKTKHLNINSYFLCKFTDVTLLFDLNNIDLGKVKYKWCPKTSSSDGNNKYVYKPVLMFNQDDAVYRINNTL